MKQKDVKVYTAVGTLRTSSIQQGGQIMYRLTDPQTGRTVCYLRSDDPKYGTLLSQFIGVLDSRFLGFTGQMREGASFLRQLIAELIHGPALGLCRDRRRFTNLRHLFENRLRQYKLRSCLSNYLERIHSHLIVWQQVVLRNCSYQ